MTVFMSWLFNFAGPSRHRCIRWRHFLIPVTLFSTLGFAHAQEAYRASLAGEAAVEARKRQLDSESYNFQLGPMKLRMGANLEVAATDNVDLSSVNPESDISFSPSMHVSASWRISEQNSLAFSAGIGYRKYLQHKELDSIFITPDSNLGYRFTVGDFVFNLHNALQISQDAYNQAAINNTGNYGVFQDTAGLDVDWDLSESFVLSVDYNHEYAKYTPKAFAYQDHNSDLFTVRATYIFNHETQAGIEIGTGFINYDQHGSFTNNSGPIITNNLPNNVFLTDIVQYNIGPFLRSQLSEYMAVTLAGGYTVYSRAGTNSFGESGNTSSFYAGVTLEHRLNERVEYSFAVGREVQLGTYSSTIETYYARLEPAWQVFEKVTLRTPLFFEYDQQPGVLAENVNRFGAGVEISYQVTQKLQSRASYNYLERDSNIKDQSYIQNRLVLDLQYSF